MTMPYPCHTVRITAVNHGKLHPVKQAGQRRQRPMAIGFPS